MNTLLLVVVVVMVAASNTLAKSIHPPFSDIPGVRGWPWMDLPGPSRFGYTGPRPGHHPGHHPGHYPVHSPFPSGDNDFLLGFDDYADSSSFPMDLMEDHNRRIMEVQRRCQEDFLLLRRLLQEQGYPLRDSQPGLPWFFPIFRVPYVPDQGKDETDVDVEEKPPTTDEFPQQEEVDFEDYVVDTSDSSSGDKDSDDDETLDSPTPGPEWHILPYLPEVPNADDLPENYENATHTIHVVNGTRVEVNTTTNKQTENDITTFFHTEIFNILPNETPEEETPEEVTPEEVTEVPEPSDGVTEEENEVATTMMTPEEPPVEEETENESPVYSHDVLAEMVNTIDHRPARGVPSETTTKAEAQQSASYVKRPGGGTSKGKAVTQTPKDLSGDTLVNHLPGNTKGGKPADPDAERINDEFL